MAGFYRRGPYKKVSKQNQGEVGKEKSKGNQPQSFSLGDWEEGVAKGKN